MARLYYSRLSQDVIVKLSKIGSFGAPRFKKVNSQILDVHFQVTHLRTCGKVWFSNHRGRRSKKKKEPAAKYNGLLCTCMGGHRTLSVRLFHSRSQGVQMHPRAKTQKMGKVEFKGMTTRVTTERMTTNKKVVRISDNNKELGK